MIFFLFLCSLVHATSEFDSVIIDNELSLPFLTPNTVPYFDGLGTIQSSGVSPTQLGYVDFTSSGQTQLNSKAPLASPALSGTPTAPTQTQGDNSTRLSTTAYVDTAVSSATIPDATSLVKGKLKLAGDLSGTADLPTVPGLAGKQNTLTFGNLTTSTTGVTVGNGASSTVGPNVTVDIQTANTSQPGLISSTDWNTFNGKQSAITPGTTAQYWRGDLSFQTLNTSVVTEGSNLYFTNARAQAAVSANTSAQMLYVSQDSGNDSNTGSLLSPFKTIGAAITAANAIAAYYKQVVINISPSHGTSGYVENLTLSQQGVNLQCVTPFQNARPCVVSGTLTVNLTGTSGGVNFIAASNEVYVMGLSFTAGASNAITFSGSTYQRLVLVNCYIQAGAAMAVNETNTGVTGSTPSELRSYDTTFENNSSTIPTVTLTAGRFWLFGTIPSVQNDNSSGPSLLQNGPSSMQADLTQFTGQYQLTDNTATAAFNLSTIASGTASCISTPSSPSTGYVIFSYSGCNSSNTNSMTGSGVVVSSPGNARINTSGDLISTITQSVFPGLPQGEVMIGAGATTGTNIALSIKDGHMKIAQTTAPTTTLSGNAGTGGTPACTITNGTDSDGKISLKTGTASWATGTQCTINFNKTWGVAPICTFSPSNDAGSTAWTTQRLVMPDASTSAQTISAGVAFSSQVTVTFHYHCRESQ